MEEDTFKFNYLAFILAFAFGILFVYLSAPKQKIVIKYPTPYNVDKVVYRNQNDICYKYKLEEIKCSDNAINQPIF